MLLFLSFGFLFHCNYGCIGEAQLEFFLEAQKLEKMDPTTQAAAAGQVYNMFMSTQGKGNFTFEILKNGAKPGDVNPIDGVDSLETPAAVSADELDTALEKPRLTGPGARAARATSEPKMTKDVLGREKRKR